MPVVDKNGLPLCLPVAPLGAYSTVQLPGCGYKELFHRQLLQDLLGRQLPDNVDDFITACTLFCGVCCPMVRKSHAPRGPTKRQKERRALKELKLKQKNEARFASAVRGSQASLLDQDFQFVTDTLQENPRWIQPLAGLIRSGALNGILNFTCE